MMGTERSAAPAARTLHECKVRASILLKDIRSTDPERASRAAERFRALPAFAALSRGEVLARRDDLRRKHALAVVAAEEGFASWAKLKAAREAPRANVEAFFTRPAGGFLNHWFARYEDAAAALPAVGGFLFPFRDQFVVVTDDLLEMRGIDPADADWERIGRDWVRPRDAAARDRLERKLIALGYSA